ncbi:MAG: carboxypeptidase-like regulatory domain-containing protein [Gemmatimonadota bacterium]
MSSVAAVAAAAALVLVVAPARAPAQVIRGHVVDDSTEVGLPDVEVALLVDSVRVQRVVTDTAGSFSFDLPDSATVQLEGRRLGWRTVLSRPLHVSPQDTVTVELWMGIRVIPVAPLYVTARSDLGRSRFYRHMEAWGEGVFLTPAMVDSIDPIHPVDVLRGQEETWLSWRFGQRRPVPNVRTYLGQGCVAFMVNGVQVRRWAGNGGRVAGAAAFEDSVLETLEGRDIVAVEYYRSIGEVPPELRRYADIDDVLCGLVVYWTAEGW